MECRTLVFYSLNRAIEFTNLMSNFFLNTVDIFFIVLDLYVDLLLELIHVVRKAPIDYSSDLLFVYFLGHFCFLHVHIEFIVQRNFIIVPLSFFIGGMINVDTHFHKFFALQLDNLAGTFFLHGLQ